MIRSASPGIGFSMFKFAFQNFLKKIFDGTDDIVCEYLARLINTIASFSAGRLYMSKWDEFIKYLIRVMMKSKTESLTSENILGGLQKLSLR